MATQFYMTIPSNSILENTAAEFITSLPINIHLEDEWEVGLAEIIYGNTWFNVNEKNNSIHFRISSGGTLVTISFVGGRYTKIESLLKTITDAQDVLSTKYNVDLKRYIAFEYNEHIKKCQLMINTNEVHDLYIPPEISYILGFGRSQIVSIKNNTDPKTITSNHPVDMSGGLNHLFVYCDILKPQIVGNVLAPLLQIVSIEGSYTDVISRIYISPHYVPVLKKSFNTLEINIKNDQNKPFDFEFGKTIVKLHFRKIL